MGDLIHTLVVAVVLIYPLWRIFSRAGLRPALSLLIFFPGFGIVIVSAILAFSRWPTTEGAAEAPGGGER